MKYSARDLHDIISIAALHFGEVDEDTRVSLERLSHDTKLLLTCKAEYELDPLLVGQFYEDMAKLEKIFCCYGVDLEKEFPKS
ncbi:MAG: hypothetical protein PHR87_05985 [Sulfurospirillaceae bacterium]|nr:hypothetical protein [Sulfurospirillaceae bacterium]